VYEYASVAEFLNGVRLACLPRSGCYQPGWCVSLKEGGLEVTG
jgi:hypothetical protein